MLNTTGECKVIAIANQKSGAVSDTRQSMTSNVKAYMLTASYNAPSTMRHYFQQEVNQVMAN